MNKRAMIEELQRGTELEIRAADEIVSLALTVEAQAHELEHARAEIKKLRAALTKGYST